MPDITQQKKCTKISSIACLIQLGKLLGVILIDDQSSKCQAAGVNNDLRLTHECDKNYYF